MFAEPLDITDGITTLHFYRTSINGQQAIYNEASSTDAIKQTFRVIQGTGAKDKNDPNFIQKRHVVTLARDEFDSTAKRHEVATVTLTISHPNTTNLTRAELDQMTNYMRGFLNSTTFMDRLYRGEL